MDKLILEMLFIAVILNIENIQAFQFLISRPSSAGFLIALPAIIAYKSNPLIYPFIMDSFTCGLIMELIIIDFNPVGGTIIPNGVIGAAISSLLLASGCPLPIAFFSGFLCAFLYSKIDFFMRTKRNNWNFAIEKEISQGKINPGKWIFFSILLEMAVSAIFLISLFYLLAYSLPFIARFNYVNQSFNAAFYATIFIGLFSLFFRLKNQVEKNG